MLAFRETKFTRSRLQSYTRLRNGRWLISRSRRLRFSRCWKRRTDYQQNFKAKSRCLTVIRKRRGLVRRPDPANLLGLANTKEKQMARFVLVHGGFSGAWIWLPLMDRLKAAGHVVEAFDLPGMGNDNTSASEISLESYAGRVCEVLAANSEPAVVVGHSMGGIVATQAAARCPERVAALVYVAAFLPKDGQSLIDLLKLPEGAGEQVLSNVVVDGEPPVAVMPAAASRHALYGSCADNVAAWAIARQCT